MLAALLPAGFIWWSTATGGPGSAQPSPGIVSAEAPERALAPVVPARRAGAVTPEPPTSARLPSGVVVPIVPVATTTDGLLDVPDDVEWAGWWQGGSRLGDPFGSALVAAHVDSRTQGLGPYAELLEARAGQRVLLTSAHLQQTFVITSLELVAQGPLTDQQQMFAPSGPMRLTLVTCAPPYDASSGGYQNLAVVTAEPVSAPTRKGA